MVINGGTQMNNLAQILITILIIFLLGLLVGYNINKKPKEIVMGNKIEYVENKTKIDSLTKQVVDLKYELKKQKDKLPDISDKDSLKTKSREYLVDSIITPLERIGITQVEVITTQELTINYLQQNNEILEEENKELTNDIIKEKRLKNIFLGTTIILTITTLILI